MGQLVNLYPNPSTDQITICFNVKKLEIKIIEFYNNKGQVIHRLRTNEETIKLNTTVLSKGLNFYKIYTSEELLGHGKFIVK
ncbi:MAG TPA: T9SS type A sorting domain-containing protein [Bacteroidales bacterium]|nr:T9SS type A sorting domain-containing protein [Bacteroidales bacterium]